MKLLSIYRFEFLLQLRSLTTWLFFAVITLLSYQMVLGNYLPDALYDDFFLNSPFVIAVTSVFGGMVWLLTSGSVAGLAAARDNNTGIHPLVYTAPISKLEYLGGRFLAALSLNMMILLGIPIGILLAIYLPGVPAEVLGPFRPVAYLTAFFYITVPHAFITTAIQFTTARLKGRVMAAYIGTLFMLVTTYLVTAMFYVLLDRGHLGQYSDAIGAINIVSDIANNWTPAEKSSRMITLGGAYLTNRIIWTCVGLVGLTIAYARFRFLHPAEGRWFFKKRKDVVVSKTSNDPLPVEFNFTQTARTFNFATNLRQAVAMMWLSFWMIMKRRGGFFVLGFFTLLLCVIISNNMDQMDTPHLPRAEYVLSFLTSPFGNLLSYWTIVRILLIIYAGEIVWREREARVSEITDTSPVAEWTIFLGQFMALALFLSLLMSLLVVSGIFMQLILNYHHFEIGLMVKVLFALQLPEYLLAAFLGLVIHIIVNNKYIGLLVAFIVYMLIGNAARLGIEHNMLVFGSGPQWYYTDMRGFGASIGPWLWFKLYWVAWALLLAVAAILFWVRGKDQGFAVRMKLARFRLTQPATAFLTAFATVAIIGVGGFVFYNTNILNDYTTTPEVQQRKADYEKRYGQYENASQPELADIKLRIELYPKESAMDIQGTYQLVNKRREPIDSIHIATVAGVETNAIKFDRAADVIIDDNDLHHHIYRLKSPLLPGDSVTLTFEVASRPQGFTNNGIRSSIVQNGTYFTQGDEDWMPSIGYQSNRRLSKPGERRKYGLPQRPPIPSVYEVDAHPDSTTSAQRKNFEAIIGTEQDQIAVAPGELRQEWIENGRRYFKYVTSGPIGGYSILSANYKLMESTWEGIAIKIYYHPGHTTNIERMMKSVKATLAYHTREFGPYQYTHITLVEKGGLANDLSAESALIDYSETFTRFNPENDEHYLDFPFAVIAHEVGHQWWGSQLTSAYAEGAGLLSESLAWFTAMGVVEETHGRDHLDMLLELFHKPDPVPPIHQSGPLIKATDRYANYRKGPFALYAMTQYIGRDSVNGAIRKLLEQHRDGSPPLPTSLELYRNLQAATPDSLHYLLRDLFEVNTSWDLETDRATVKKIADNRWDVTMEIETHKMTIDSTSVEIEMPMNDWIDVGLYNDKGELLYLKRHRVGSGKQVIRISVGEKPVRAGIDPKHLLIDPEMHDNFAKVNQE